MYWLVGAGAMARSYAAVMRHLGIAFKVIGRGRESAERLTAETGAPVVTGGIEDFLLSHPAMPDGAIVAVGAEELASVTSCLLRYGVRRILVEKPMVLYRHELDCIFDLSSAIAASVFIAYNRRFFKSVRMARKIIEADEGVKSFSFEFTEWAHVIESLNAPLVGKQRIVICNSAHVIDLAFHLGGEPLEMDCRRSGGLSWHPAASIFAGCGISQGGGLFSYQANWTAPGRWGVEIMTKRHRLILRPLETIGLQVIGGVAITPLDSSDHDADQFKPGLFDQVKAFVENDRSDLCGLDQYRRRYDQLTRIAGYPD